MYTWLGYNPRDAAQVSGANNAPDPYSQSHGIDITCPPVRTHRGVLPVSKGPISEKT